MIRPINLFQIFRSTATIMRIATPRTAMSVLAAGQRPALSLVDMRQGQFQSYDTEDSKYTMFNKASPVWACNEWDPLEEVLIGRPDNAVIPYPKSEVKACLHPSKWKFFEEHGGKYWADVIPEHWKKLVEECNNFVKIVESDGIKVVRPDEFDFGKEFKTPFFQSKGFYSAMPRDFLMVVGDEIIESTLTWRQRYFEFCAYRRLIIDYWKRGAKWTAAPKPTCDSNLIDENYEAGDMESRGKKQMLGHFVTSETEPCFDAADFLRAGTDLFGQRSQVTNKAGIEWLRRHLAPRGYRVHELNFRDPRPMHIDGTFQFVKPGYALRNPVRPLINEDMFLKAGWKIVDVPIPDGSKDHPMWLSSEWLSMNTLMRDPEHVYVEKGEKGIQRMYEKLGVKPIPIGIYHMNSIGGGFHCWTCDLRRRGKLECYF